jgi:hypothetical protein
MWGLEVRVNIFVAKTFSSSGCSGVAVEIKHDIYLWGYLKDRVFQKNPHTIQELKFAHVIRNCLRVTDTLTNVMFSFF